MMSWREVLPSSSPHPGSWSGGQRHPFLLVHVPHPEELPFRDCDGDKVLFHHLGVLGAV